jgi:hypothetical protein
MEEKTIYDLKLHDRLRIDKYGINVLRVPGGWLYSLGGSASDVFVPYSDEFNKKTMVTSCESLIEASIRKHKTL